MFDVAQDPERCCTEQYCIAKQLAPPLAARAAVYLVLPPPVGGAHFYKYLSEAPHHSRSFSHGECAFVNAHAGASI